MERKIKSLHDEVQQVQTRIRTIPPSQRLALQQRVARLKLELAALEEKAIQATQALLAHRPPPDATAQLDPPPANAHLHGSDSKDPEGDELMPPRGVAAAAAAAGVKRKRIVQPAGSYNDTDTVLWFDSRRNEWLSNFYWDELFKATFDPDGRDMAVNARSVEQAYQWAWLRFLYENDDEADDEAANIVESTLTKIKGDNNGTVPTKSCKSGAAFKSAGSKIAHKARYPGKSSGTKKAWEQLFVDKKGDWQRRNRNTQIMENNLRRKFAAGTRAGDKLVATGNKELKHYSMKDSDYWGTKHDNGENDPGENTLGKLIMKIRAELQALPRYQRQEQSPIETEEDRIEKEKVFRREEEEGARRAAAGLIKRGNQAKSTTPRPRDSTRTVEEGTQDEEEGTQDANKDDDLSDVVQPDRRPSNPVGDTPSPPPELITTKADKIWAYVKKWAEKNAQGIQPNATGPEMRAEVMRYLGRNTTAAGRKSILSKLWQRINEERQRAFESDGTVDDTVRAMFILFMYAHGFFDLPITLQIGDEPEVMTPVELDEDDNIFVLVQLAEGLNPRIERIHHGWNTPTLTAPSESEPEVAPAPSESEPEVLLEESPAISWQRPPPVALNHPRFTTTVPDDAQVVKAINGVSESKNNDDQFLPPRATLQTQADQRAFQGRPPPLLQPPPQQDLRQQQREQRAKAAEERRVQIIQNRINTPTRNLGVRQSTTPSAGINNDTLNAETGEIEQTTPTVVRSTAAPNQRVFDAREQRRHPNLVDIAESESPQQPEETRSQDVHLALQPLDAGEQPATPAKPPTSSPSLRSITPAGVAASAPAPAPDDFDNYNLDGLFGNNSDTDVLDFSSDEDDSAPAPAAAPAAEFFLSDSEDDSEDDSAPAPAPPPRTTSITPVRSISITPNPDSEEGSGFMGSKDYGGAESQALTGDQVQVAAGGGIKILRYPDLAEFSTWDELVDTPQRAAAVLFLVDSPTSGHWMAAFDGPDGPYVFDPIGLALDAERSRVGGSLKSQLGEDTAQFKRLLDTASGPPHVNRVDFQKDTPGVNTCGRWVGLRIQNRHMTNPQFAAFVKAQARGYPSLDAWVTKAVQV
jgi:hypothetical protein